MGENRIKDPKSTGNTQSEEKHTSIFSLIEKRLQVGSLFDGGLPVKYIPYILYVTSLGVLYIANTHYSDRLNRSITKLHKEVEELKSEYTTLKSDYMFESKQSEVGKKVEKLGLIEDENPPRKIVIKKGE